jgi:hypothetical protein
MEDGRSPAPESANKTRLFPNGNACPVMANCADLVQIYVDHLYDDSYCRQIVTIQHSNLFAAGSEEL